MESYISKDMTIGDVVNKYPDVAPLLTERGLHCVGCHVSPFETIEQGCLGHGMSEEQIDDMVNDANEYLQMMFKHSTNKTEDHHVHGDSAINITDNASKKINDIMQQEGKKDWGLRVRVVPGGCSGFSYEMDFEQNPENESEVLNINNVKVFIDENSKSRMGGANIDYVDGLHGSGFKISNPAAHSSCGCGKSFS